MVIERCEDLQVLRYKPGVFLSPSPRRVPSDNKRTHTIMMKLMIIRNFLVEKQSSQILKDLFSKKGDALVFNTITITGGSMIAVFTVVRPSLMVWKWFKNTWVHERPYY